MAVKLLDVGVQIRKVVVLSVRTCYRSVCRHPFLVGFVFFLIFLYRSFPFVFSLLVSASPILVSTAILLGTLLSFGQPNIPEIEKEEKINPEIASLKTGGTRDATVVERDGSYPIERYTQKGKDVVEKSIDETIELANNMSDVDKDDSSPFMEEKSREFKFEKELIEEAERDLRGTVFEQNSELNGDKLGDGEVIENLYSPIQQLHDENLESEIDKSPEGFIDFPMGVHLSSPPGPPWKHAEEGDDDDDDDDLSDSGSDGAESSSPDASMADIIPLLDELHPLLDEDAPQPVHLSHDGSDTASVSEHSSKSSYSGNGSGSGSDAESDNGLDAESGSGSDADSENHEELEVGDDEEEEEEETHVDKDDETNSAITWTEDDQKNLMHLGTSELERNQRLENLIASRRARKSTRLMAEESHVDKEDETKSAITWTEDDQKNLMHLGTSELERNQRLENLIARRRARKSSRLMAEKNLIDLESDLPFNVAAISTTRHNPFDLPYDSNDNIPGSAPSILLPRRNPFDLPYDSSEEKPDLVGDTIQQDFVTFQTKEPFFRRHESFNVGPSIFGAAWQEKQDIKLRPYFVPERMALEGTNYSSFQRQLSDLSESKVSSVPETESMGSDGDVEHKKLIEEEFSEEPELISNIKVSSIPETESMGSDGDVEHKKLIEEEFSEEPEVISNIKVSSVPETEQMGSDGDVEHKKLIEEKYSQEPELISNIEHASEHIGHGSETSEDVETVELGQVEKRNVELNETEIKLEDEENHQELESSLSEIGSVANSVELNTNEVNPDTEAVEQKSSSGSSSSSTSEVDEKIFNEKEGEGMSSLEQRRGNLIEKPGISMQLSIEKSDITLIGGLVEVTQHKEPVYDSSPPAVKKNLSSSSLSSDLQVEIPEMGSPPALVKRTISFAERESELGNLSIVNDTSHSEEMSVVSSELNGIDENKLGSGVVTEVSEHGVKKYGFSGFDQNSDSANASTKPESVVKHSSDPKPSSGTIVEEDLHQDEIFEHKQGQLLSSSFDADIHVAVNQGVDEKEFTASSLQFESIEDQNLALPDEKQSLVVEQISHDQLDTASFETGSIKENLMDKEVALQFDQDQAHSSNSDGNFLVGIHQEADEKLVSEEKVMSQSERELPMSDKSMDPSSDNPEELQEQLILPKGSVDEASTSYNSNVLEVHEMDNKVAPNIHSTSTPEFTDIPSEVTETKAPPSLADLKDNILDLVENGDRIRDIEATDSHVEVQNDREDEDEIKEIDEGLLLELDTVGDFSVKNTGSNLNEIGGLEDDSIEIHEIKEVENPRPSRIEEEISEYGGEIAGPSELQMSGTGSVQDVDSSIREFVHGEVKDLIDLQPPLPEETEVEPADSIAEESNFGMPVLEERSLEDINSAFKQIDEKEIEKPIVVESIHAEPIPEETMAVCSENDMLHEGSNPTENKLELPVLEARSVKDIDLAFEQLQGGTAERSILPSSVGDGLDLVESQDLAETPSDVHVVERRYTEVTNAALNQVSDSEDGSAEFKANEAGSSKDVKL